MAYIRNTLTIVLLHNTSTKYKHTNQKSFYQRQIVNKFPYSRWTAIFMVRSKFKKMPGIVPVVKDSRIAGHRRSLETFADT